MYEAALLLIGLTAGSVATVAFGLAVLMAKPEPRPGVRYTIR